MDKKRLYILIGVGIAVLLGVICFFELNKTNTVAVQGGNIDRTEWVGLSTVDVTDLKTSALSAFDEEEPEERVSSELEF